MALKLRMGRSSMARNLVFVAALVCAATSHAAVRWSNVDADHHLAGRKASEGYLQGKVVLVDRWGAKCPPCRADRKSVV